MLPVFIAFPPDNCPLIRYWWDRQWPCTALLPYISHCDSRRSCFITVVWRICLPVCVCDPRDRFYSQRFLFYRFRVACLSACSYSRCFLFYCCRVACLCLCVCVCVCVISRVSRGNQFMAIVGLCLITDVCHVLRSSNTPTCACCLH